jgi:hypothetical protein
MTWTNIMNFVHNQKITKKQMNSSFERALGWREIK